MNIDALKSFTDEELMEELEIRKEKDDEVKVVGPDEIVVYSTCPYCGRDYDTYTKEFDEDGFYEIACFCGSTFVVDMEEDY